MLKKLIFLIVPLFIFGLIACNSELVFPVEPQIAYIDIQPRVVRSLQDSIEVTIRFQDGDGDLGALNQGEKNLVLIDSRIVNGMTIADSFSIPNLTPDAKNPSIQGEITVTIPLTVNTPGQTEEQTRYQIKMWDRAGNLATPLDDQPDNAVFTDYITIRR